MKVKIKCEDGVNDIVKIKCSGFEYLVIREALERLIKDKSIDIIDRQTAQKMYNDLIGDNYE